MKLLVSASLQLVWLGALAGGVVLLVRAFGAETLAANGGRVDWLGFACGACVLAAALLPLAGLSVVPGRRVRGTSRDLGEALREHTLTSRPVEARR